MANGIRERHKNILNVSEMSGSVSPLVLAITSHLRHLFDPSIISNSRRSTDSQQSNNFSIQELFSVITEFKSQLVCLEVNRIPLKSRISAITSINSLFGVFIMFQKLNLFNFSSFFRLYEPIYELTTYLFQKATFDPDQQSNISMTVSKVKWDDQLSMEVSSDFVDVAFTYWGEFNQRFLGNLTIFPKELLDELKLSWLNNLFSFILLGLGKVKKFGNSGLARLSLDIQLLRKELLTGLPQSNCRSLSELESFSKVLWMADFQDFLSFIKSK
ncbi:hypothetical protein P9112_001814 [Eukaryota sp. TZLM1-RC]